jgi:hypothetical protein
MLQKGVPRLVPGLRERWLERVNAKPLLRQGNYDVSRQLRGGTMTTATATELNIPSEDPAIRNSSGGYVTPSTFPVA